MTSIFTDGDEDSEAERVESPRLDQRGCSYRSTKRTPGRAVRALAIKAHGNRADTIIRNTQLF